MIQSPKKMNVISDFKLGTFMEITGTKNSINKNRSGILVNMSKNMIFLKDINTKRVIKIAKNEVSAYRTNNYLQPGKLPGKRLLGRPEEVVV